MGIWRNIGKIVSLSFQIVYEEMKWHIHSWTRNTTKKSNPLDELSKLKKRDIIEKYRKEEQESIMRSKRMVELCEMPYYND